MDNLPLVDLFFGDQSSRHLVEMGDLVISGNRNLSGALADSILSGHIFIYTFCTLSCLDPHSPYHQRRVRPIAIWQQTLSNLPILPIAPRGLQHLGLAEWRGKVSGLQYSACHNEFSQLGRYKLRQNFFAATQLTFDDTLKRTNLGLILGLTSPALQGPKVAATPASVSCDRTSGLTITMERLPDGGTPGHGSIHTHGRITLAQLSNYASSLGGVWTFPSIPDWSSYPRWKPPCV